MADVRTCGVVKVRARGCTFAKMDPARLREVSSLGGVAARDAGIAHRFTAEEQRRGAVLGGQASVASGRVAEMGRLGGAVRRARCAEHPTWRRTDLRALARLAVRPHALGPRSDFAESVINAEIAAKFAAHGLAVIRKEIAKITPTGRAMLKAAKPH